MRGTVAHLARLADHVAQVRLVPLDLPLPDVGTEESETLDFKRDGYAGNDSAKYEAAADLAQFANNVGGRLIIGADAANDRLEAYVGLADAVAQEQRIASVASTLLAPRADVVTSRVVHGGNEVLVITVQPHEGVVGVRLQGGDPRYRFPVRSGKDKRWMTFEEVETMWTADRRAQLLVSSIPADRTRQNLRISADLERLPEASWELRATESGYFTLRATGGVNVNIPYAFVVAVWPSAHEEFTIALDCALTAVGEGGGARILVQQKRRA